MRARIRRFKVYVWQRKRGEGPSVGCTPQCKRGVRCSVDVRPNALQSVELASDKNPRRESGGNGKILSDHCRENALTCREAPTTCKKCDFFDLLRWCVALVPCRKMLGTKRLGRWE